MKPTDIEQKIEMALKKERAELKRAPSRTRLPRFIATALLGAGLSLSATSCIIEWDDAQPAYGVPMCEFLDQSVSVHLYDGDTPVTAEMSSRFAITIDGVSQVDHSGLDAGGNPTLSLCVEDFEHMENHGFEICVTDNDGEFAQSCTTFGPGYEGLDTYTIEVDLTPY